MHGPWSGGGGTLEEIQTDRIKRDWPEISEPFRERTG